MPQYRIRHLTRYTYEEPVSVCHNLAHLLPRQSPRHFWSYADLEISPVPAVHSERIDYFGNRLTFFAIQEPHRELNVLAKSIVKIEPTGEENISLFGSPAAASWESVRDHMCERLWGDDLEASQFVYESPGVQATPEVHDYAQVSFTPNRPIGEALLDLTSRIHHEFVYDTKATTATTTLPEIMNARRGVCQDFAHLQIGCLRSLGLPARYVSGYLLTVPPPGTARLVGADASHAWLSLYIPGHGWLDIDPTNDLIPSEKHITIAWGRDFGDVSPLRGVILGGGKHTIHVSVDVSPLK